MATMYSDLKCYRLLAYHTLDKSVYDLAHDVVVVAFIDDYIEAPDTDPICAYSYAGTHKYLWNDKTWNSYLISWKQVLEKTLSMRTIDDMLNTATAQTFAHIIGICCSMMKTPIADELGELLSPSFLYAEETIFRTIIEDK